MLSTRARVGLAFAAVLLLFALGYPILLRSRERTGRHSACRQNMRDLVMAMRMYAYDSDGLLPPASQWCDALLMAYLDPNSDMLKCPRDRCAGRCSYGMNSALGGKALAEVGEPPDVVLFYETVRPARNPSGGPSDVASPPRHDSSNLYALSDATVCGGYFAVKPP